MPLTSAAKTTRGPVTHCSSLKHGCCHYHTDGVNPTHETNPTQKDDEREQKENEDLSATVYKRELPSHLISFASAKGKRLFRESLRNGDAESYFGLANNFSTQSEPAFCGPASLAMVLNTMGVDPQKRWRKDSIWRWYSDELLDCCAPLDVVRQKGITFTEFACLAKCHADVTARRGDSVSKEQFRSDLQRVVRGGARGERSEKGEEEEEEEQAHEHMVVSFSRKVMGQTGGGHFSPIGAYHEASGMALVLDVARYKYPSYFASVDLLYEAMKVPDPDTGLSRGYFLLRPPSRASLGSLCRSTNKSISWSSLGRRLCSEIPSTLSRERPTTLEEVSRLVLGSVPIEVPGLVARVGESEMLTSNEDSSASERGRHLAAVLLDARSNPLHRHVLSSFPSSSASNHPSRPALATLFLLSIPMELFASLPTDLFAALESARNERTMPDVLRREVERVRDQLRGIMDTFCVCGARNSRAKGENSTCLLEKGNA